MHQFIRLEMNLSQKSCIFIHLFYDLFHEKNCMKMHGDQDVILANKSSGVLPHNFFKSAQKVWDVATSYNGRKPMTTTPGP